MSRTIAFAALTVLAIVAVASASNVTFSIYAGAGCLGTVDSTITMKNNASLCQSLAGGAYVKGSCTNGQITAHAYSNDTCSGTGQLMDLVPEGVCGGAADFGRPDDSVKYSCPVDVPMNPPVVQPPVAPPVNSPVTQPPTTVPSDASTLGLTTVPTLLSVLLLVALMAL